MSFKDDYAKFKQPSPEREAFVFKTITNLPKSTIIQNMKPISVKKPDGTILTYKVMPDYLMIDGIRVPMSGSTAQNVANHFGLSLPSAQMAKEIYQNADVKVPAKPLSGSGTTVDGKSYSGKDVVQTGVGYAPFAISYNDKINKQLSQFNVSNDQIVSGFAKDIVAPIAKDKLGLFGLFDESGKPIQGGSGQTPHDTSIHSEYGSFVRLVSPIVEITYPDGKKEIKPTKDIYNISNYSTSTTNKSLSKNNPNIPSSTQNPIQYSPPKPQGRLSLLQRIDNLLSQFNV